MKFDAYIQKSKENCANIYGLKPEEIPFLKVSLAPEQLEARKRQFEPIRIIIQQFMQKILTYTSETPILVVATDGEGYVLDLHGDQIIHEMVEMLGITKGVRFAEKDVGTNSVSLALTYGEPFQLIGNDHYHHCLEGIACFSAPFSYGEAGTVSLMTTKEYATPFYLGLLSSTVDAIEREIKVQLQNERFHLMNQVLMNATPLGIVMTNQFGEIREMNESAERITGWLETELISKNIEIIPELKSFIRQVLHDKRKLENIEVIFSQGEIACLLDVMPLFDRFDQFIGVFAQFRDMQSYYDLQKRVVQSEKLSAIGKLGAGFAHEIRNPLTSIIGLTQLMDELPDEKQREHRKIIKSELERMRHLVDQFVMLGKVQVSQKNPENLQRIIQDTVCLMKSYARENQVTLHLQSASSNPILSIDGSQIKQVLINFIKNAIEAQPDGGYVRISLYPNTSSMTVKIIDAGPGMSPQMLDQLGSPFISTKEDGLGMGLAISLDLIKAHHGTYTIHSTEGEGTTVEFTLPLYNAEG
ncbi:ATP-binding protein [Bacillus sp. N1-1]|uniref:ATP-binding protein n=1 Tax=Bacillus sp. N1-1 TaxID=2682541 RepID=UPI0013192144|nr:ATP-binding protein [Bacillus sp. N1-1]QHA93586.1 PAS domain-containing protein [Bacillus sp. N1-1]